MAAPQEAFSGLLGDSNEVTQEMASRGISAVYAMSDEAARKQLLDGLVSTLQGVCFCSLLYASWSTVNLTPAMCTPIRHGVAERPCQHAARLCAFLCVPPQAGPLNLLSCTPCVAMARYPFVADANFLEQNESTSVLNVAVTVCFDDRWPAEAAGCEGGGRHPRVCGGRAAVGAGRRRPHHLPRAVRCAVFELPELCICSQRDCRWLLVFGDHRLATSCY